MTLAPCRTPPLLRKLGGARLAVWLTGQVERSTVGSWQEQANRTQFGRTCGTSSCNRSRPNDQRCRYVDPTPVIPSQHPCNRSSSIHILPDQPFLRPLTRATLARAGRRNQIGPETYIPWVIVLTSGQKAAVLQRKFSAPSGSMCDGIPERFWNWRMMILSWRMVVLPI